MSYTVYSSMHYFKMNKCLSLIRFASLYDSVDLIVLKCHSVSVLGYLITLNIYQYEIDQKKNQNACKGIIRKISMTLMNLRLELCQGCLTSHLLLVFLVVFASSIEPPMTIIVSSRQHN